MSLSLAAAGFRLHVQHPFVFFFVFSKSKESDFEKLVFCSFTVFVRLGRCFCLRISWDYRFLCWEEWFLCPLGPTQAVQRSSWKQCLPYVTWDTASWLRPLLQDSSVPETMLQLKDQLERLAVVFLGLFFNFKPVSVYWQSARVMIFQFLFGSTFHELYLSLDYTSV